MKTKLFFLLIFVCILSSCSNKEKEAAIQTTKSFFNAIRNDKSDLIISLYPNFKDIGEYYKSDSIIIKEAKALNDDKYEVIIENHFTNGFGKKFNQEISIYLNKDIDSKEVKYSIYDSKGMRDFEDDDNYLFAVKTGCINSEDITDLQIAKKLNVASKMMTKYAIDLYVKLKSEVEITDWEWESGYGGSASGKAIVKNNSEYDIPKLKYQITYKDRNLNEITSDDGYVSYDDILSGSSKAFTFYTSYVGNAQKASISLDFDTKFLIKCTSEAKYTGNEYEEFIKSNEK